MGKMQRHTVYDSMENAGFFAGNPANADAVDLKTQEKLYKGPVQYPKMLYHPKGEMRVIVPGVWVAHPTKGQVLTDEQSELIYAVAEDAQHEKKLLGEGWHPTPAHAHAARKGEPLPKTAAEKVLDAEAENRRLTALVAELEKKAAQQQPPAKK